MAQTCTGVVATVSASNSNTTASSGSWTVPAGGPYRIKITAKGAKGGNSKDGVGGSGATMQGEFIVSSGQTLSLVAGAPGTNTANAGAAGGGGGTGVRIGTDILLIAGGGGGAGADRSISNGGGGTVSNTGTGGGLAGYFSGGGGGLSGNGGSDLQSEYGRGGTAGFTGVGGAGGLLGGGYGGGGVGGGGGGAGYLGSNGGGGGGGYSGGNGGDFSSGGSGGGSINNGTNQVNTAGAHAGPGEVIIECLGSACPSGNTLYVNQAIATSGEGTSWASAFKTLQEAIAAANTCNNITQIWVAQGTYYPDEGGSFANNDRNAAFKMKNNVAMYGGFIGTETQLQQRNWKTNVTILSGEIQQDNDAANNALHVIFNNYSSGDKLFNTAVIDGFTITGGNANTGAYPFNGGGGMFNYYASPSIFNCTFSYNSATDSGGGLVSFVSWDNMVIENCLFTHNSAMSGGGLVLYQTKSDPTVSTALLVLRKNVIANNTASLNAGGIWIADSRVALENSVIANNAIVSTNSNSRGAGLFSTGSAVSVLNCTVYGNTNTGNGAGGFYFSNDFAGTPLRVVNSIFWNNRKAGNVISSMSYAGNETGGPATSLHDVTYSTVEMPDAVLYAGTGNKNQSPLFVNAADPDGADNIWKTADDGFVLQAGSPSINTGTNTGAPTTDIIGTTRALTTIDPADMGAYEAPVIVPVLTINNITQSEGNSGTTSYSFTVSLSSPAPAGGVTFDIATADNTATIANNDYVAKSLTAQTIAAGSSTYTFDVTVNGDVTFEPAETFFVNITNVTGATVSDAEGIGTIHNDDNIATELTLTSTANSFCIGYPASFTATLTRTSAPAGPLAGQLVTITFNGPNLSFVTSTTNGAGQLTVQTFLPIAGSYSVTASFTAAGYNPDSDALQITVNNLTTWYLDKDGDGRYLSSTTSCTSPGADYKTIGQSLGDCDDNDDKVWQSASLYIDADGDGYDKGAEIKCYGATVPTGYSLTSNGTDCNDTDAAINPSATEVCDGIDNNCNGQTDEGFANIDGDDKADCVDNDDDNDGVPDADDCDPWNSNLWRRAAFFTDADRDGYGTGSLLYICYGTTTPTGYSTVGGDCNDANGAINPGASEICGNNIDDNCNGATDENCNACANATGFSTTNITGTSASLNWVASSNPVQWQLRYKTTNLGSKWIDLPSVPGTARSYALSGLKKNQSYNWQIRAKCGNEWTVYSASESFKTTSAAAREAEVTPTFIITAGLRIYPNPGKGQYVLMLQVEEKINATATIQLMDYSGRIIQTENAVMNNGILQKQLNTSSAMASGVYMVRIVVNNHSFNTQLIYQK